MGHFATDAMWPTHAETVVHCYDEHLSQKTFTGNSEVFPTEQSGSGAASLITVPSWVLFDSGEFTSAFALADRIFRDTLPMVRAEKSSVSRPKSEIIKTYALSEPLLGQITYLLRREHFIHDPSSSEWTLNVQLHHLDFPEPTLEDLFVKRPTDYSFPGGRTIMSPDSDSGAPGKRLTDWVFVGSTWADLGDDYRPKVLEALLSQRMLPLGMENWSAVGQPSIQRSMQEVAEATLALFVLGERYGSRPYPKDPRSFTEIEYDAACARRIEVIAFLSEDDTPWNTKVLDPPQAKRQKAFRARVLKERHVRRFRTPADLFGAVIAALVHWERGGSAQPVTPIFSDKV
jgi:hypothetical protein